MGIPGVDYMHVALKTLVGMFATGNGRNSTAPAYFSDFEYVPVEGVF